LACSSLKPLHPLTPFSPFGPATHALFHSFLSSLGFVFSLYFVCVCGRSPIFLAQLGLFRLSHRRTRMREILGGKWQKGGVNVCTNMKRPWPQC